MLIRRCESPLGRIPSKLSRQGPSCAWAWLLSRHIRPSVEITPRSTIMLKQLDRHGQHTLMCARPCGDGSYTAAHSHRNRPVFIFRRRAPPSLRVGVPGLPRVGIVAGDQGVVIRAWLSSKLAHSQFSCMRPGNAGFPAPLTLLVVENRPTLHNVVVRAATKR